MVVKGLYDFTAVTKYPLEAVGLYVASFINNITLLYRREFVIYMNGRSSQSVLAIVIGSLLSLTPKDKPPVLRVIPAPPGQPNAPRALHYRLRFASTTQTGQPTTAHLHATPGPQLPPNHRPTGPPLSSTSLAAPGHNPSKKLGEHLTLRLLGSYYNNNKSGGKVERSGQRTGIMTIEAETYKG